MEGHGYRHVEGFLHIILRQRTNFDKFHAIPTRVIFSFTWLHLQRNGRYHQYAREMLGILDMHGGTGETRQVKALS